MTEIIIWILITLGITLITTIGLFVYAACKINSHISRMEEGEK